MLVDGHFQATIGLGVVQRAEDWRWSSLWARRRGDERLRAILCDWSVARPRDWAALVNEPMTEHEAAKIQACIARNRPYGDEAWQSEQAQELRLLHTLRAEGRPKAIRPRN